jgi:hypothetical protein
MFTMNRCNLFSPLRHSALINRANNVHRDWTLALFTAFFGMTATHQASAQNDTVLTAPNQAVPINGKQGRQFPPKAVRGYLRVVQGAEILIDGKLDRLSPGARIRDPQNAVVMTGALPPDREYVVNYVRETYGNVHQVWILTEQEIKQKLKSATPETNFFFSSDADKPKVDDGKTPFDQLPRFKQ